MHTRHDGSYAVYKQQLRDRGNDGLIRSSNWTLTWSASTFINVESARSIMRCGCGMWHVGWGIWIWMCLMPSGNAREGNTKRGAAVINCECIWVYSHTHTHTNTQGNHTQCPLAFYLLPGSLTRKYTQSSLSPPQSPWHAQHFQNFQKSKWKL